MLKTRAFEVMVFTVILMVGSVSLAAEGLRSGPQPGDKLPSAFHPLNVTGEFAGKKHCLVCENGLNPVVMIFAREVSEPLVQLIAKVDEVTAQNRQNEMGSFVVFLSFDEDLEEQLPKLAKEKKLKHLILSIDHPAGPQDYQVAQAADVTVVLYTDHEVKANHAFKKGELTDKAIERILADVPKILPKK
ncbi:MAG: hypothetical protein ACK4RK_01340 [Gemmataceae bacterium]